MAYLKKSRFLLFSMSIITISFVFMNSCKEDSPASPEENIPPGTEITIGTTGGELTTEGFSLSVPQGSFQNETTLSISKTEKFNFFGDNRISETFIIDGIPSDFSNTLRMAIKYTGTLNDSSYIAVTSTTDESFIQDSTYFYEFFSVKDSSGFLVTYIDKNFFSNSSLLKSDAGFLDPLVMGQSISDYDEWKSNYFHVEGPGRLGNNGIEFAKSMDEIFLLLKNDLGFDFKYNNHYPRYNLKYETTIFDIYIPFIILANYGAGEVLYPQLKFDKGLTYIHFYTGENLIYSAANDRAALNMSFILLNQIIPTTFNDNKLSSKQELLEAITWFLEDHMGINNPPSTFEGNMVSLFGGFDDDGISPGLSSMIKYLVQFQNYDIGNLGKVFEDAHDNNTNHYYSVISDVDNLITTWFPDYYEKLFKGDVYDIDGSVFLDGITNTPWQINSDSDSLFTFTTNYSDLSIERNLIELNHEFEDESASLLLETSAGASSDGTAMIVFSVDGNDDIEHVITARAEPVELQNLKAYYQNGTKKFLVVVVNCINNGVDYTGLTEIELKAEIKKDDAEETNDGLYSIIANCGATLKYNFLITSDDGTSVNSEVIDYKRIWFMWEGNIENGIFNGTAMDENEEITYSVTINFSEELDTIKNISLSKIEEYDRKEYTGSYSYGINFDNIAMTWSNNYGDKKWSYVDESVCDYIAFLEYSGEIDLQNGDRHTSTLVEYSCEERARFEVTCNKILPP